MRNISGQCTVWILLLIEYSRMFRTVRKITIRGGGGGKFLCVVYGFRSKYTILVFMITKKEFRNFRERSSTKTYTNKNSLVKRSHWMLNCHTVYRNENQYHYHLHEHRTSTGSVGFVVSLFAQVPYNYRSWLIRNPTRYLDPNLSAPVTVLAPGPFTARRVVLFQHIYYSDYESTSEDIHGV